MGLLDPLEDEQKTTFLVVSLELRSLLKMVGRLGTAPPGTRLDRTSGWELAWSLIDFYASDPEVAKSVDRTLRKEVAVSPLAAAVAAEGGAPAIATLLLDSEDPVRDLAWAVLAARAEGRLDDGAGEVAKRLVDSIIAEFDDAEARAKEEEQAGGEEGTDGAAPAPEVPKELVKDAQRARTERDRARSRLDQLKDRLVELEGALRHTRRELKTAEALRVTAEAERDRLATEREAMRARLASGTAAEVSRLGEELETARRRVHALETDLEGAHGEAHGLEKRVRELEALRRLAPSAAAVEEPAAAADAATWSLPVFSDEFYDSIRRWDRKIIRNAFEKVARLAEDWRRPSLRAIPLEGLPDYFRIRIATDVRLIYRPIDGGRIEILSLIDREDLTRYIRQAKTRS